MAGELNTEGSSAPVERAIRVLIAEPYEIYRRLVESQLAAESDIEVVATPANGREALSAFDQHEIDAALVELKLDGDFDGLRLLKEVVRRPQAPGVVIFTDIEDPMPVFDAFMHGAKGLLHKTTADIDLPTLVRQAMEPGVLVCPKSALMLRTALERGVPRGHSVLTAREREVLKLVSIGMSRPVLAQRLVISSHTVNTHMRAIYRKLGVRNQREAINEAQRRDLL